MTIQMTVTADNLINAVHALPEDEKIALIKEILAGSSITGSVIIEIENYIKDLRVNRRVGDEE